MSKSSAEEQYSDKGINAYNAGERPKKAGRVRNCCKRFWWLWIIIVIVVILVVVLPIIFVGIPNMAQSQINDSTLEITRQDVTNSKPDSVDLSISSVARSSSKYHPDLDAFTANLFLEGHQDKPFGSLNFPALKVEAENKVDISQTMKVTNMDQFNEYNKMVIGSETFKIGVTGKTGLHLSGLPSYKVDYTKIVSMKGLNKLNGFKIESFDISLAGFSDGSNLQGVVYIPNPSVLTIELGKVTLNLAADGTPLGYSVINDMTLRPGDNRFNMSSFTSTSAVLGALGKHSDGILPVEITGNSSVNSAGEHLTYYEEAIKSNVLTTQLDVGSKLKQLGGGS